MPRAKSEWNGIHQHNDGWRAVVSRGDDKPIKRFFQRDTPPSVMQQWRREEQARWTLQKPRKVSGSFRADVTRYLDDPGVISKTLTFKNRKAVLDQWVSVFGDRQRSTITPDDIRHAWEQWQAQRKDTLAPGTRNIVLMILSNVWTILDGRQHYNPVKEVRPLSVPQRAPRDLTRRELAGIFAQLSDRGQAVNGALLKGSKTKARLLVMATTGLPPSTLKRLTPADVDIRRKVVYRPARRKGKGQGPSAQPLTADAVAAFKQFAKLGCWGTFNLAGTHHAFQQAAKKAGITRRVTQYDLRHTFLTNLAKASKDEVAVMEIAQHGSINTTRKYTSGSVSTRVREAMAALERRTRRR